MNDNIKEKENLDRNKKSKSNKLFTGSMFIGIGLGFLFENIPAGTMIGMGIGFITQQVYSNKN